MKTLARYLGVLLLTQAIGACLPAPRVVPAPAETRPLQTRQLHNQVVANCLRYENLSFRAGASVTVNDKTYHLRCAVRIEYDRSIRLDIDHVTGISVARILMTREGVTFRIGSDGSEVSGGYASLGEKLGVDIDYQAVQAILTGELFFYPHAATAPGSPGSFVSYRDADLYYFKSERAREDAGRGAGAAGPEEVIVQTIAVDPHRFKIHQVEICEGAAGRYLKIDYLDFLEIRGKTFPRRAHYAVVSGLDRIRVDLRYQGIVPDGQADPDLRAPVRCTKDGALF